MSPTPNGFVSLLRQASCALRADWKRNAGNPKMLLALFSYRIAHVASRHRKLNLVANLYAIPVILAHRFLTEWLFCMELPAATTVGKGLIIDHGYAMVVNKNTVIGDFCRLRHGVTIGCKTNPDGSQGPSPVIGNRVEVGANAILIGNITIGDDAVIGAGAVVVKDVPAGAVAVGNPAKVVRLRES